MNTTDKLMDSAERQRREELLDRYIIGCANRPFSSMAQFRIAKLLALPFDEKERYVRRRRRTFFAVLAVIVVIAFSWNYLVPHSPPTPIPPPVYEPAGTVQSVELHSTALSTETTVRTTVGTFQVRGGVSAGPADPAKIKRETFGASTMTSLCIESKIKAQCYQLL